MKQITLALFLIAVIIWFGGRLLTKPTLPTLTPEVLPTPTPAVMGIPIIYQGESYRFVFTVIASNEKISLMPNYENKYYSNRLIDNKTCTKIFNAGFYNEQSKPLGLILVEGKEINPAQTNQLLNGFFSITENDYAISATPPGNSAIHAFQSGPILVKNGVRQTLKLTQDKNARRVIVALDQSNQAYFITLYDPNVPFGGPRLESLPAIINLVFDTLGKTLQSALNLDGGTASVFYTSPSEYLREIQPVGSFLCVN